MTKACLRLAALLFLVAPLSFSQTYNSYQKITFTAPAIGGRIMQNGLSSFHSLVWTVTGTLDSCSIEMDTSADGTSWALGGLMPSADCHLDGNMSASGTANFVRMNVTVLSTTGGSLTATYKGFAQGARNPMFSIDLPTPGIADSGKYQVKLAGNGTFARISCSTDTGTASINLDVRQEVSPNSASGNPVLAASLVCDTDSQVTTTIARPAYTANQPIALLVTATSGSPSVVRVHAELVPQQ